MSARGASLAKKTVLWSITDGEPKVNKQLLPRKSLAGLELTFNAPPSPLSTGIETEIPIPFFSSVFFPASATATATTPTPTAASFPSTPILQGGNANTNTNTNTNTAGTGGVKLPPHHPLRSSTSSTSSQSEGASYPSLPPSPPPFNLVLPTSVFPFTITSYLDGPHFAYDKTSAFNYSTPVTPESYQTLLTNECRLSEINIGRNVSFFQSLASHDSDPQEDPRHIVLSRDTSVVLELDFTPDSDRVLPFNALKIPFTRSVDHHGDQTGRQAILFDILLIDALTDTFVPVDEWVQESPVDFEAEESIIDLRNGKAVIRFKIPCCFLDSINRSGSYRICISFESSDQRTQRNLPGIFEVAHMDENLPECSLQHPKEATYEDTTYEEDAYEENTYEDSTYEETPHCPPHNYCCLAHDGNYHSDCKKIIEGCFTRAFSLALGRTVITLQDILTSEHSRRILYSLSQAKRRWLKDAMKVEYRRLKYLLIQARLDITMLRGEYEAASRLTQLTAPIHQLPVELLILTFSFIPGGETQKFATLLQTCRKWRDIILSIWGPLRLTTWTSVNKVKSVLDRYHGPLSVTIDPSTDALDVLLDSPKFAGLALALSTSTSRWRTLKVLSLPDPQQIGRFFGHKGLVGNFAPLSLNQLRSLGLVSPAHILLPSVGPNARPLNLNQLRSLSIPIHHDPSPFLDLLLPSISPTSSVQLTNMHLCSAQAILYFVQPHCAHVFNSLTSFKCSLRRTDDTIDILPHLWVLELLDVSHICFPTYGPDVELPLTKTLRRMSLHGVRIGWMNHRKFPQLESCTIVSPPPSDVTPIASLPLCMDFHFEGPRVDIIENLHIPAIHTLTLYSPQWGKPRGNLQFFRLYGAVRNEGFGRLISLHLDLTCSTRLLLGALHFMVELKDLVLKLGHPTVPGRRFFIGLLPQSRQNDFGHEVMRKGENQLCVCPSLEVLGLKYRRWLRPSEPNNMLLLVAMVSVKRKTGRGLKIWVDKGVLGQERVEVVGGRVSASTLRALGCLRFSDFMHVPSETAEDITMASRAILHSSSATFRYSKTITYLSPTVYPSLFPWLRMSTLATQMDHGMLLKLLPHLEHLEQLSMPRLVCESPMPGLSLFQTLKRMHLGEASLHWMMGCTFVQLEDCRIDKIDDAGLSTPRSIRMPMCSTVSMSPSSVRVLDAFDFSQLHHLHLSMPHDHTASHRWGEGLYASMRQFNLRSVCFQGFDSPLVLRSALAVQNELEVLEIIHDKAITESNLSDLFDVLTEPNTMGTANTVDNARGGPRSGRRNREANRKLPLCPDLRTLRIKLGETTPEERPAMVHIVHQFMAPKKPKRRPLEHSQFSWEKDGWNIELTGSAQLT